MLFPTLIFSDSAKYAEAAKNIVTGKGFVINHSFFNPGLIQAYEPGGSFPTFFHPLNSWILSFFFRFLPATDLTVAITGLFFFVLAAFLIFLIAKKLHSTLAAIIAVSFFVFNHYFIEYALNFSTEMVFIIELLLFAYFILASKWTKWLAPLPIILMFFTRPQAIVVVGTIALTSLAYIFSQVSLRRAILRSVWFWVSSVLLLAAGLWLLFLSDYSPLVYSGALSLDPNLPQGAYIRGLGYSKLNLITLTSKIFYNFYNYFKDWSRLISPIVVFLFASSPIVLLNKKKDRTFLLFSFILFFSLMLVAAATLPNARYVQPAIPFVVILAAIVLVELLRPHASRLSLLVSLLLTVFILIPEIGYLTLDAHFRQSSLNLGKPSINQVISQRIAKEVPQGQLIITNLDAWAAWYSGLTTMWFPLKPEMLTGYQDKISYIVITNYKEHDGDFALGSWKEVVYSPDQIENKFLNENYRVLSTFEISENEVYEDQGYRGTILVRNDL